MARIDHTACTHPRTPAGRRGCRAGMASPIESISARIERTRPERKARLDAVLSGAPKRIQPRRSGARVAVGSSTCVQAALHIDAHGGRCACGWVALVAA